MREVCRMAEELVRYERRDRVAIIAINRPQTLNALDMATLAALETCIEKAESDADVRVIVFTGVGRAFVAGGDIADLNSRQGLQDYQELAERLHRVFRRIELLLCTDLRFAAASAKLGLPEITLGMFPGAGGTQRLIRQIPLCKAKELMFIGERIDAKDAERIGLINRVVSDESLMDEVLALAEKISQKSPLTLKLLKRTLNNGADMPLASALHYEQAMISLVLDSADAHEGCTAFLEKRAAKFAGV